MRQTTTLRKALLVNLLILLCISQAGSVSAGANVWTSSGPEGGVIQALAIDPATPATLYAGTSHGVFKSTNGGGNWGAVNTGLPETSLSDLAIDPATPATLYAGTGDGVFKSTNGGGSWNAVNTGLTVTAVYALTIDPTTPATLYAGTYGGGVFKSTNGGGTWNAFNLGLPDLEMVSALAIDAAMPSTLYAGTSGGVFAIQQTPRLVINYTSGAPGSFFTITGSDFPPDSTATIAVNGNTLGTVPTDSSGGLIFLLSTSPTTEEGHYSAKASVNFGATVRFTLDVENDVRPQEGSGAVFAVPDGTAYRAVYLPLVMK